MKKLTIALGLTYALASCETEVDKLNKMKSPVIVKSKGYAGLGDYGVLLKGADGHMEYFSGAPFESLKIGDTLK